MDIDLELNKLPEIINQSFSLIGKLANLKYHYLIYKLLKKGHVKMKDVIEDTGLSETRIYQIIDSIEKIINEKN